VSEFFVDDKVYVLKYDGTKDGPYVVASVDSVQKTCTLSTETGEATEHSGQIAMAVLVKA
jgi:hypothetical protein